MMKCIFATTLELRWACRVLKPRISAALSEIRAKQATQRSESQTFKTDKGKKTKPADRVHDERYVQQMI
jgi:hypothetical protein